MHPAWRLLIQPTKPIQWISRNECSLPPSPPLPSSCTGGQISVEAKGTETKGISGAALKPQCRGLERDSFSLCLRAGMRRTGCGGG